MTLKLGELCAGYGGLGMAVEEVFGAETAWFSEFDAAPSKILAHHWPDVPNYGDMTKIDWAAIEPVDIISGGTPCQDLSAAGRRAGMTEGTRSNLWVNMREAIAAIRPEHAVWENVRGAYSAEASSDVEFCAGCMGSESDCNLRALGRVLGDLSDLGYDCQWRGLRAADVGAPHGRFRVFVLAQNTNLTTGRKRRLAASGQTQGGWTWPHLGRRSGAPIAHTSCDESERWGIPGVMGSQAGEGEAHGEEWQRVRETIGDSSAGARINWGPYTPAIRRWEAVRGAAPAPTEQTPKGNHRLSARFAEWMMGLPDGWVTDPAIGLTRNEQLKACGNGVVPQQATAALRDMLAAFERTAA